MRSDVSRIAGSLVLLIVGCTSEVDQLGSQLLNGNPEERRAATRRLKELGPEAEGAVLELSAALSDEDDEVRRTAARALGRIGPGAEPAAGELRKLLAHPNDTDRLAAAYALVEIVPNDPAPIEVLSRAAVGRDPRAIVALGQLGRTAEPALPLLRQLAGPGSPDVVRSQAAEAIRRIEGE